MRIRSSVLLILLFTGAVLTAVLSLVADRIIGSEFDALEHKAAVDNALRARHGFLDVAQGLDIMVTDWATWDDTYEYVQLRNEDYEEENLIDATFVDIGLHLIAVMDTEGMMVWGRLLAPAEGEEELGPELDMPPMLGERLVELATIDDIGTGAAGLLLVAGRPMLLAVRPILTSERGGPARGALTMGRFVTEEVIVELQEKNRLNLSFSPVLADAAGGEEPVVQPLDEDWLAAWTIVQTLDGEKAYELRVSMPRELHKRGGATVELFVVSLLIVVLAAFFLVALLLQSKVLSRLRLLADQVQSLGSNHAPDGRVRMRGSDEITQVADSVNAMLDRIQSYRSSLSNKVTELERSEHFMQQLFVSIHAGVLLIDPKTHIIEEANTFALGLIGAERDEVVGRKCHEFICPAEEGACPVTDLKQRIDLSVRTLLRVDGSEAPVLKSVSTVERGGKELLLETFIDISHVKELEDALRLSEEMYRIIFENTGTATAIIDRRGVIHLANAEFSRLAGAGAMTAALRKPELKLFDFMDRTDATALLQTLEAQGDVVSPSTLEVTFRPREGEERTVTGLAASLPEEGRFVVSLLDVTERRKAEKAVQKAREELEEKVRERTRELQDVNKALVEMDALKSAFLSSASHELRTPLTSIVGFTKLMHRTFARQFEPELAKSPKLKEKAAEFSANFDIIKTEGERLTRLINDLLDLNKIESGRMEWRDEPFDLVEQSRLVVMAMQGDVEDPDGLQVYCENPPRPVMINADRDRIIQVLYNLVGNAIKFTEKGEIKVTLTEGVGEVQVCIADTGPGIPAADLERIFDKFYQIQAAGPSRDKPVGAGLGLAISRNIVAHYGGRIWAESSEGGGSAFCFTLPLR